MSLALFGHPFSSYTWKALIPLYANGTSFEFRALTPGDEGETEFLRRVHPAGKFPVLTDGDTTVIEATSIVEYLAVHHAGSAPLISADPAEAVTVRMLDRVFDNYVMGNMQRVVAAHFVDRESRLYWFLRHLPRKQCPAGSCWLSWEKENWHTMEVVQPLTSSLGKEESGRPFVGFLPVLPFWLLRESRKRGGNLYLHLEQ